jgi:hypothetical protein
MKSIYISLIKNGDFSTDMFIENPSEDVLRSAYDFARESGRLEDHGYSLKGASSGPQMLNTAPTQTLGLAKGTSLECKKKAAECVADSSILGLTCLSALVPGNAIFGGGLCGAELTIMWANDGIPACKEMKPLCPLAYTYTPQKSSAGATGSLAGQKTTMTCSGMNRVVGLWARYKDWNTGPKVEYAITKLKMLCSNGVYLDYISNVSNTPEFPTTGFAGGYAGGQCGQGYMVQGIRGRSGNYIDAIGRICDRVVSGTEVPDRLPPLIGDEDGGSEFSQKCGEHGYVYGMHIWHDAHLPAEKEFITGVEPICSK